MRCSMRESHCSRHRNEPQLHPARNSTTHRVLRTIELPCRQSTESTPERPIIGTSAYHYPRKSSGGDRRCFRQHSLTLTLPATLSRTQGPPLPSVAGGRAAVRTGHKGTAWGCEARSTTTRGDGESRGGVDSPRQRPAVEPQPCRQRRVVRRAFPGFGSGGGSLFNPWRRRSLPSPRQRRRPWPPWAGPPWGSRGRREASGRGAR